MFHVIAFYLDHCKVEDDRHVVGCIVFSTYSSHIADRYNNALRNAACKANKNVLYFVHSDASPLLMTSNY